MLAEKVPDLANIIAGAVFVAVALGDFGASPAVLGAATISLLIFFGAMVAFAWLIGLLDWLARRRGRKLGHA